MNLVIVTLWNRPPACTAMFKMDGHDLAIVNPTNTPYLGSHTYQLWKTDAKTHNLSSLVAAHPEIADNYEYIWWVDDDVRLEGPVSRLFEIMKAENFDLAQPSLTHHSYHSHQVTLHDPRYRFRRTSFVELMAPCFSRDAFRLCYSTLTETYSGWGMDWVWPQMLMKVRGKPTCAVIDELQMTHTCPVSSGVVLQNGKQPVDELREIWAKYNPPGTIVYEAVR